MLGPFHPSTPRLGGLLWKIPWRISSHQKRRQRKRLRLVDGVISTLESSLHRLSLVQPGLVKPNTTSTTIINNTNKREKEGAVANSLSSSGSIKAIEMWRASMPDESEMVAKDKYTVFDRKEKKYRKGIHKVPKWTRVSQRVNPPGF